MITFNLSTYGVTVGTGQSEATQRANTAAIYAAINAANAASATDHVEVVHNAVGTIECYLDPAVHARSRDVGTDITTVGIIKPLNGNTFTLRGQGATSRIAFFPDAPSFTYNMFYVDGYLGRRATRFATMSVDGPVSYGGDDPLTDPNRYLFYHQGSTTPGAYARYTIEFEDVITTGIPTGAFSSSSGDCDVRVLGTTFRGMMVAGSVFNPGNCQKTLYIEGGDHANLYDATAEGVCWYIHPNVWPGGADGKTMFTRRAGVNVILGCPQRFGVYINGTEGVAAPAPPSEMIVEYITFSGSDFMQTSYVTNTVVRNINATCNASESFILSRGVLEVYNCVVNGGVIQAADGPIAGGRHAFQTVHDITYTSIATVTTNNFVAFANGRVYDCTVNGNATAFAVLGCALSEDGDIVTMERVIASGNIGRGFVAASPTSYSDTVPLRVDLIECEMTGTSPFLRIIGSAGLTELVDIRLYDCVTDDNSLYLFDCKNHIIRGSGNVFRASFPFAFFGPGIGPSIQDISNRHATVVGNLASAGTLNLNCSYDEQSISGTATINTIYLANDTDQNQGFVGHYKLNFVAAASLSAAGNIVPLSTSPRAPGSSALLFWNNSTGKWVEYAYATPMVDDRRALLADAFAVSDQQGLKPVVIARDTRPNAVGVAAALASMCMCTLDGTLWMKTGPGDTDWDQLAFV